MEQNRPKRKPLRLSQFDYSSPGAFFLTICTVEKQKILCRILQPTKEGEAPQIMLFPNGVVVDELIRKIPGIEKYVIMPNHVHLIVFNNESGVSISRKIQYFKSNVTRALGRSIWQREYYDHVIRGEEDYRVKWKYIDDNPAKWSSDELYSP